MNQINKTSINPVFKFQDHNINIFGSDDNMMFFGGQVSRALGYVNSSDALIKFVWSENKTTIKEYIDKQGYRESRSPLNLQPHTILINEFGLYQLILSSKLEKAKEFQKWIISEVLPTIRKTGSYNQPQLTHNQFVILNESDLQMKVVQYLKKFHYDLLFHATLGELQDTPQKRINSYNMGYTKGIPDLIIYEHNTIFNGLTIEFKSPKGTGILSQCQTDVNIQLSNRGYLPIISDDYDQIILEINHYLLTRRFKCKHCRLKYKSIQTLRTHVEVIHKK